MGGSVQCNTTVHHWHHGPALGSLNRLPVEAWNAFDPNFCVPPGLPGILSLLADGRPFTVRLAPSAACRWILVTASLLIPGGE